MSDTDKERFELEKLGIGDEFWQTAVRLYCMISEKRRRELHQLFRKWVDEGEPAIEEWDNLGEVEKAYLDHYATFCCVKIRLMNSTKHNLN